jgi:hypothetical protein
MATALPNTGATAAIAIGGSVLLVIAFAGLIILIMVFNKPLWSWRAKRHKRESSVHEDRFCYFCHGTATRLVRSYVKGQWQCKDSELCRKTSELRKLLNS